MKLFIGIILSLISLQARCELEKSLSEEQVSQWLAQECLKNQNQLVSELEELLTNIIKSRVIDKKVEILSINGYTNSITGYATPSCAGLMITSDKAEVEVKVDGQIRKFSLKPMYKAWGDWKVGSLAVLYYSDRTTESTYNGLGDRMGCKAFMFNQTHFGDDNPRVGIFNQVTGVMIGYFGTSAFESVKMISEDFTDCN